MPITRLLTFLVLVTYLVSDSNIAFAQRNKDRTKDPFQVGYFMFPIQPGQQASLSGGFGDLRTNHFHAGIDIRTGGIEGYNVYAAAEGYVSRLLVRQGGYGNALYITHPNGYTTLYGHLKNYNYKIEKYLREKQYAQQAWPIEIVLQPNEIIVQKGEIVAISGNTGASGGPHLHFEIRDENENALNPLRFGFPEIQDSQQPVVERVVLKTLNANSRVNGEFGRVSMAPVRGNAQDYTLPKILKAHGTVGLELYTYDKSQTSPFRMGINELEVQVDGRTTYKLNLQKMPFDISKDINVHIDYDVAESNGVRIQKCYVADGNRLSIYETDENNGKIIIKDNQLHNVFVKIKDSFNNESTLSFSIQGELPNENFVDELSDEGDFSGNIYTSITENTLAIRAKNTKAGSAILQYKGVPKQAPLAYTRGKESVYLYDLNQGIVDFVQVENSTDRINIKKEVLPKAGEYYAESNLQIDFNDALYDTLYLKTTLLGNKLSINTEKIPLKDFMTVTWKPSGISVSPKSGVYYVNDGRKFLGGTWIGNEIQFKTKELGDFQIISDFEAPAIRPVKIDSTELRFTISDALSGIQDFNCYVNGQWVLMDYEYKSHRIWSIKRNEFDYFSGDVKVEVTDNVGNVGVFNVNVEEYIEQQKLKEQQAKRKKTNATKRRKSSSKSGSKKSKRKKR